MIGNSKLATENFQLEIRERPRREDFRRREWEIIRKHRTPRQVQNFLRAHVETTQWIAANADDAKKLVNAGLQDLTGKALGQATIDNAWKLISVTNDPVAAALTTGANNAYALGFLSSEPDLSKLFALDTLNAVLKEKNLAEVKAD